MRSLSFVPCSATLRVLFVKARARLMATCDAATLTDEQLAAVTEELNRLADAVREAASRDKGSAIACGRYLEGSIFMSQRAATALADSAERRHAIKHADMD
jgi:hypothetical protein